MKDNETIQAPVVEDIVKELKNVRMIDPFDDDTE